MAGDERELLARMDRIGDQLAVTRAALHRNESHRTKQLVLSAGAALAVGLAFVWTPAGADWEWLHRVPGWPATMAAVLCLGGLVLFPAVMVRHRPMEMVGLAVMVAWYAVLAVGLVGPLLSWVRGGPTPPSPWLSPLALYVGGTLAVHFKTVWRLHRAAPTVSSEGTQG